MTSQTLTAFSADALPVITHHDHPVMTTDLLATMYGTTSKNIRQNFNNNQPRFVSGKHYFKVDGPALKEFKQQVEELSEDHSYIDLIDVAMPHKFAPNLLLWTERGAARHAKMLDTDQAWDIFERLEDAYFDRHEGDNLEDLGITSKEYDDKDDALLKTLVDYGKIRDEPLRQIAFQRIVRLCRHLGYPLPDGLTSRQMELGI